MKTNRSLCIYRAALLAAAFFGATFQASAQYSAPVHDVDHPARQPYKYYFNTVIPSPAGYFQEIAVVPSGKRLVIDYVNVFCNGRPAAVQLLEYPNLFSITATLSIPVAGTTNGGQMPIYAYMLSYPVDPGNRLGLQISASILDGGGIGCGGVITGHYVNLP